MRLEGGGRSFERGGVAMQEGHVESGADASSTAVSTRKICVDETLTRRVGDGLLPDGKVGCAVELRQHFPKRLEEVWAACTRADHLKQWLGKISGELSEGGSFRLENGTTGIVQRCTPPRSLFVTWDHGGESSWLRMQLRPARDGTSTLSLVHLMPRNDYWEKYGPSASGVGWELYLLGLRGHLESGGQGIPDDWSESAEGREFAHDSSEAWAQAQIEIGATEAKAHARAETAALLYTGDRDD